jgi:hypothetical protein
MRTTTAPVLGDDPSVRIVLALEGIGLRARLPPGKASRGIVRTSRLQPRRQRPPPMGRGRRKTRGDFDD